MTAQAARKRLRATGPTRRVRELVYARDGRACVVCGSLGGLTLGHRRNRGMGGTTDPAANRASALITQCWPCNVGTESDPAMQARAYEKGWKLRQGTDPRLVRCWIVGRGPVFLLDDGQIAAQPEPT